MINEYNITPSDLLLITEQDVVFSTTRFLPTVEQIPREFRLGPESNAYVAYANALFASKPLPPFTLRMKEGYDPALFERCVMAHLGSWAPKHQHKLAGVGLMISCMATLVDLEEV